MCIYFIFYFGVNEYLFDEIKGVVFQAVKKDGTLLFDGVSGVKGVDHKDQPMTKDTVFWTASITKVCFYYF